MVLYQRAVKLAAAGFAIAVSVTGCGDDITITPFVENRPPQILLSGPEYETTDPIKAPLPAPWVLATDPDGADDIAAVVLNIESITLNSVIVRPDDAREECRRPYYADNFTIDIMPYLDKQTFRVDNLPLGSGNGGFYGASLTYNLLTEGGLGNHGDVFGPAVKSCRWGSDYLYMLEHFGLYPPALVIPRDAYVTYADLSVSGITMTVYDWSGETVTAAFPDLRGFFTNSTEERTPP